jgi:predicted transposase YdaD
MAGIVILIERNPSNKIAQRWRIDFLQFERFTAMKESSTYQAILAEGEQKGLLKEARKLLLSMGTKKLGPPDNQTKSSIEAIGNLTKLEALTERLLDVSTWQELLS